MLKILLGVIGGLFILGALGYFLQPLLLYFPEPEIEATPEKLGLSYQDVWLQSSQGNKIHAWFIPGPGGVEAPVVLFMHGNSGNISHRLDLLRIVQELGLACLMPDYQGYGQSQGKPSEQGMYQDAHAAWDFLVEEKGVQPEQVVVWGHSLGGPVAARLAMDREPGALILDSTFTSVSEMGRKLYPFLPVKHVFRYKYPTQDYLQQTQAPVLVVHSSEDGLVPFELGRKLYQAAPSPKEFLEIRGEHDYGFVTSFDLYAKGVEGFLQAKTSVWAAKRQESSAHIQDE
ncbi:MAG: alpha/beta hydrolase [Thermodesulfobacteriota bacterium]